MPFPTGATVPDLRSAGQPRPPRRCCAACPRTRCRGTGDGGPVGVTGQALGVEQRPLPEHGRPRSSARSAMSSSQASPGRRISARSRSRCRSSISSTRHQSRASPTARSCGWRRPRRSPGPPRAVHAGRAPTQPSGHEYQPLSPPMPSMTDHSASRLACTGVERSSTYSEPPAQSGSLGSGSLGAPGGRADDHRVATSGPGSCCSASSTARVEAREPAGGSGTYARDVVLLADDLVHERLDERPGDAVGTGVTSPTQWLDSRGVSTGRDDAPRRQAGDRRVPLHHLAGR